MIGIAAYGTLNTVRRTTAFDLELVVDSIAVVVAPSASALIAAKLPFGKLTIAGIAEGVLNGDALSYVDDGGGTSWRGNRVEFRRDSATDAGRGSRLTVEFDQSTSATASGAVGFVEPIRLEPGFKAEWQVFGTQRKTLSLALHQPGVALQVGILGSARLGLQDALVRRGSDADWTPPPADGHWRTLRNDAGTRLQFGGVSGVTLRWTPDTRSSRAWKFTTATTEQPTPHRSGGIRPMRSDCTT